MKAAVRLTWRGLSYNNEGIKRQEKGGKELKKNVLSGLIGLVTVAALLGGCSTKTAETKPLDANQKEATEYTKEQNASVYQLLDEEAYDNMLEELSNERHWLTGYPYFTQTDPREYEEKYQYYDTLLFQMDSDYGDDKGEDYIMWGDAGVANFFINQKDLEKRDFSRILYNWDCC